MDEVRATPWPSGCTLLVLTGGSSRRLGRDKATIHVGGRRLVDRLLAGVPATVPVVIVGPTMDGLTRDVTFVREDPPGSGPLAGIGAGLVGVCTPHVGVIAADMPFALPVVVDALTRLVDPVHTPSAGRVVGAVLPVDPEGFGQLLCAAYVTDALRGSLAALGSLAGLPVRAVLPGLDVVEWSVPAAALADVDTEEQLTAARFRAVEEGRDMQEWVDAVRAALGVDIVCDIDAVLDVARDAAHNVDRPAAPVTTYLLGAAVAAGADPVRAAEQVGELARGWAARAQ